MNLPYSTLNFRPQQVWGDILWSWWRGLDDDTGGRAALRRAPDVTAIVLQPAYQRLYQRLRGAGWPEPSWRDDRLAAVAGLLVHVREHSDQTMPQAMSQGDKPPLSPLRFMRLLEAADDDTLFTSLRRALPLLQHRADIYALANDVVNWGDAVRKRWAYNYHWPAEAGG